MIQVMTQDCHKAYKEQDALTKEGS